MTVPKPGTIPPNSGTLTDRDPGDEQPGACLLCGAPLRPTETWFRVQRGSAPEPLHICTSCAMAKTPGRVQL